MLIPTRLLFVLFVILFYIPAGDDDGLLSIPGRVVGHDLGVSGDVLRGQLGRLVGLRVDPAEGLHFLQGDKRTGSTGLAYEQSDFTAVHKLDSVHS